MKSEYFVRISPKGQSKTLNVHSEWGGQFFMDKYTGKVGVKILWFFHMNTKTHIMNETGWGQLVMNQSQYSSRITVKDVWHIKINKNL